MILMVTLCTIRCMKSNNENSPTTEEECNAFGVEEQVCSYVLNANSVAMSP